MPFLPTHKPSSRFHRTTTDFKVGHFLSTNGCPFLTLCTRPRVSTHSSRYASSARWRLVALRGHWARACGQALSPPTTPAHVRLPWGRPRLAPAPAHSDARAASVHPYAALSSQHRDGSVKRSAVCGQTSPVCRRLCLQQCARAHPNQCRHSHPQSLPQLAADPSPRPASVRLVRPTPSPSFTSTRDDLRCHSAHVSCNPAQSLCCRRC